MDKREFSLSTSIYAVTAGMVGTGILVFPGDMDTAVGAHIKKVWLDSFVTSEEYGYGLVEKMKRRPGTEFLIQEIHSLTGSFLPPRRFTLGPLVLLCWYGKDQYP